MCAAIAATTTAGRRPASNNGHMRTCCPISSGRNHGKAAPAQYRGGDGPLTTQLTRFTDPLVEAYAEAGAFAGYRWTGDYNGREQEGFSRWQMTIRDGRRCSAARAYLKPAMARTNLRVEVGALVSRILIERNRAVGIEYFSRGGETAPCSRHA